MQRMISTITEGWGWGGHGGWGWGGGHGGHGHGGWGWGGSKSCFLLCFLAYVYNTKAKS